MSRSDRDERWKSESIRSGTFYGNTSSPFDFRSCWFFCWLRFCSVIEWESFLHFSWCAMNALSFISNLYAEVSATKKWNKGERNLSSTFFFSLMWFRSTPSISNSYCTWTSRLDNELNIENWKKLGWLLLMELHFITSVAYHVHCPAQEWNCFSLFSWMAAPGILLQFELTLF